jgi:PAS domain-containing protein
VDQSGAQLAFIDDSMSAVAQLHVADNTRHVVPGRTRIIVVNGAFSSEHDTGMPGNAPWRIEGLRPEQFLACIDDLLPGKRRSGDAHHAQAELAAIVRSSHDAIMGKTLDGRITSWNPAAERLYGYSAAEMVGQPARILSRRSSRPTKRRSCNGSAPANASSSIKPSGYAKTAAGSPCR